MRGRLPLTLVLLAAIPALLVAALVVATVADAMRSGAAHMLHEFLGATVIRLLFNTLSLMVAASLLAMVVGTAAAFLVVRTDVPLRPLWQALGAAPLAVPAFIASYAWVSLSPHFEKFGGALLVTTCAYFPLVYLPVAASLRRMDPMQEDMARILGTSPFGGFLRVVLPQLRPAVLGGGALVALRALTEFGAFAMMRFQTFTTQIYLVYTAGLTGSVASALALVLLVLCIMVLAGYVLLEGGRSYASVGRGTARVATVYQLGMWRLPALVFLALLAMASVGVPLGMTVYWLTQHGAAAVTPAEVSAHALLEATWTSVKLGLGGAVFTSALILPLALLVSRWPGRRMVTWLSQVPWLAQGLPGIVIALSFITVTIRLVPWLYQSTLLLIVAYAILFMPFALVGIQSALVQSPPLLEEIGRGLGHGWLGVLRRITLPLAMPGIGAAAALVLTSIVSELTATLLLAPLGTETLAMRVWENTSALAFASAAPYAAILIGISMVTSWFTASRFGVAAHGTAIGS